jgi:hypothetical protein
LEKYKSEHPNEKDFDARKNSRQKFKSLSAKKKLNLIKEAAENYDKEIEEPTVSPNDIKKPFSSYLNKLELKMLLESYGMPRSIPK